MRCPPIPAALTPDTYTLRVEAKGFEPAMRAGVVVKAGAPAEVVLTLAVADVAESMTVETATEETLTAAAGASPPAGNLRRDALRRLPLATARVDEALPLVPGVVRSATGEISIDGANEQQSALLVNGLNAADPASGNFRLNLPIDSVESVQVFQHPYTAEFGQFTGGLTQIETRRGGESWHVEFNDFNSYFGDIGAPVIRATQYANLPFDVPNRLLAWGTFSLPHRISIAPIFEARTGFPFSVRDAEQNFVGARNADRTRFPAFVSLDAELAKEFQVTKKYGVRLSLRGFNLTDHFNPRDVRANTADPHFGQFFAPYHRYFTGGFDIIF